MREQQEGIEQAYFKEYPCFQFKFNRQRGSPQFHINFRDESPTADPESLPSALLDRLAGREALHLLDWNRTPTGWQLSLKELLEQQWREIELNSLPSAIAISGGTLYLLSGRELAVLCFEPFYQGFRVLPEGKVVGLNGCAVQWEEGNFEPGISVVLFHQSSGYRVRKYSPKRIVQEQPSLTQVVNLLLSTKYIEFRHFQVVIPGVMAVGFFNDSEFYIFDLQHGESVQCTKSRLLAGRLQKGESPVVRWRDHLQERDYVKSLILVIAAGSHIELFFVELQVKQPYEQKLHGVGLIDVHGGEWVDWERTTVAPYLSLCAPGRVQQVAISKKGILYYSRDEHISEIGHCMYLDLNAAFLQSPVLTQEATVWRTYYQDKQLAEAVDTNSLFIPGRYPSEMVLELYGRGEGEGRLRTWLLNSWRSAFRFKSIVSFGEELLIVRTGGLSVFRVIPHDLFSFEHFSEEKLNKLQQLETKAPHNAQEVAAIFRKGEGEFEEHLLLGQNDRPLIGERFYRDGDRLKEEEELERRREQRFSEVRSTLERTVEEPLQNLYANMAITQFQRPLALSLLYDKLSYFHLALNAKPFRADAASPRHSAKEYQLQTCIIRVVNYFYGLLLRAEEHYIVYGRNLITEFLQSKPVTSDVERTVATFLRLLMENLFPKKVSNYTNSQINPDDPYDTRLTHNTFVEFLIGEVMSRDEERGKIGRKELATIIEIGFLDIHSIYFAHFWKNVSLFKGLLLANPSNRLASCLSNYLLKPHSPAFLKIYRRLRSHMTAADVATVESLLFFTPNFHQLPLAPSQMAMLPNLPDSQLDRHPQLVTELKHDIYRQMHRGDAIKEAAEVLAAISQLTQGEFDVEELQSAKERMDGLLLSDEEYLQFYESTLAKSISLFNQRVPITDWKPVGDKLTGEQIGQLNAKKEELSLCLSLVQTCFRRYKHKYQQVYEEEAATEREKESHMNETELNHAFQMVLLKQRFIQQKQLYFLGEEGEGLLCCSLSIRLLRSALSELQDSLQRRENLMCFWLQSLRRDVENGCSKSEAALTLDLLYSFDPANIESDLAFSTETKRTIKAIYESVQYDTNYDFFALFKEIIQ